MPRFRRVVHTLVAWWVGSWLGRAIAWVLGVPPLADGIITLAVGLACGVVTWRSTRDLAPWTPQDIRDGAIGWAIVAGLLIVPSGAVAAAQLGVLPAGVLAAAGGLLALALVAGVARAVHRRADALGAVTGPDRHADVPHPAGTGAHAPGAGSR